MNDKYGTPIKVRDWIVTHGREGVIIEAQKDRYGWDLLIDDGGLMFWAAADTVEKVS